MTVKNLKVKTISALDGPDLDHQVRKFFEEIISSHSAPSKQIEKVITYASHRYTITFFYR